MAAGGSEADFECCWPKKAAEIIEQRGAAEDERLGATAPAGYTKA
jgi:hypothetical protein